MAQLGFNFASKTYNKAELALLSPDDIYQQADRSLLQQLKEDRRIERKPAGVHGRELGEYLCMWANTVGGGLIVVGQEDDGTFSGCLKISPDALNNIDKAGAWHCPSAVHECKRVAVTRVGGEDDFVVLFRVRFNARRLVRDVANRVFTRFGDSKKEITDTGEIRRLEIERGQIDFEQEPVDLNFPIDFDSQLISEYCSRVVLIKKLNAEHTQVEILANSHLGTIEGATFVPNVACALLFAKDPRGKFPGCKIRILRYDGEVEKTGKDYNVIKEFWIDQGPIPKLIVDAETALKSQLRTFSMLAKDNKFYTAPEYPDEAWYEALVDACVHRSYVLKNMLVFVKMFDDKLVIESPGGFPPPVTPDTIYAIHSPRNPHLMDALYFMDFVKCHNEGTRRMRDTMQEMNLPRPEFSQKAEADGHDCVRVVLRNSFKLRKLWVDSDLAQLVGPRFRDLQPNELRILNFVAEHGSINVSQAHKLVTTPKRWHTVKKLLDQLVERGFLVRKVDISKTLRPFTSWRPQLTEILVQAG